MGAVRHVRTTHGDIETRLAFDADWLQSDRVIGAADERIGIAADADGGTCRNTAVVSDKRTARYVRCRREHCPDEGTHRL